LGENPALDPDRFRTRFDHTSAGWFEMIRLAALAISLGLSSVAFAADPPKPEPKPEPKPAPAAEEKKPVDPEVAFKRMDKDSDGKLTLEEFKGKKKGEMLTKAETQFKKLDKDSDNKVTLEEFKAGRKAPKKA
jgi:hypothetical protein